MKRLKVTYIEQNCKSILHRIDSPRLPFSWGANPYRGCLHSCIYCFARYTHSYLELDPEHEFETTIIVKKNAAKILRKELANPKWKKELVNLGSVCDPYQPIERKYEITREMLKEFQRYKTPLTVATKSTLVTRDKDILAEMSRDAYVDVVISISSINDQIRKMVEPRTSSTQKRLDAISELRESGVTVGVLLMPIIPFLNDTESEIEALFKVVSDTGANYVIPGILYLMGSTKKRFFEFIEKHYPELDEKYKLFYKRRSPPKDYREKINQLFKQYRVKYNLDKYNPRFWKSENEVQSKLDHYV
ncbi:MAG: radical SAM protein [Candidatus Heimdallarchaeota archaeon]|nr:radical SAM protein [Candidatus Heimdallarchaeota archaeon]